MGGGAGLGRVQTPAEPVGQPSPASRSLVPSPFPRQFTAGGRGEGPHAPEGEFSQRAPPPSAHLHRPAWSPTRLPLGPLASLPLPRPRPPSQASVLKANRSCWGTRVSMTLELVGLGFMPGLDSEKNRVAIATPKHCDSTETLLAAFPSSSSPVSSKSNAKSLQVAHTGLPKSSSSDSSPFFFPFFTWLRLCWPPCYSCPRAFALVIPSARNSFPSDTHKASPLPQAK